MSGDDKKKKAPEPKRVLGRGLDALLPVSQVATAAAARVESPLQNVGVERVYPRKDQPRRRFEEAALDDLARSLREQGVIQPLIVRRREGSPGEFEIIAGERRWRAAQRAGLREVPVVIKDVASDTAFEMALVENLQRQDLDPIETAQAYQRLLDEHGYTQDELATRMGKERPTVANTLRLLNLPDEVRDHVVARELSEGHARALLSVNDVALMTKIARRAVDEGWSVRRTEEVARKKDKPAAPKEAPAEAPPKRSPNLVDLEKQLARALGMNVVVRAEKEGTSGTVEIAFDSLDQLDGFLEKVLGR